MGRLPLVETVTRGTVVQKGVERVAHHQARFARLRVDPGPDLRVSTVFFDLNFHILNEILSPLIFVSFSRLKNSETKLRNVTS